MAARYTCRLSALLTPSGKFRVRYAPLHPGFLASDEKFYRLFALTGPEMVLPPEGEVTAEELSQWELSLNQRGYSFAYGSVAAGAALVEVACTLEDRIPKGAVKWQFLSVQDLDGNRTFAIELRSEWREQIPKISLATCASNETPQPVQLATLGAILQSLGSSESFFQRMAPLGLDALPPRLPVNFVCPIDFLPVLRSRVASLSPERYWVELRTEGLAFDRIPGDALAAALDDLGE